MPTTEELLKEAKLDREITVSIDSMTLEEREMLPKVLFPETHTNEITVLRKVRELYPIPMKVSRQVDALLEKVVGAEVKLGEDADLEPNITEDTIKTLMKITKVLAQFYGEPWDDIRRAVDVNSIDDLELSVNELIAIANGQAYINGVNDFFLQKLRLLIKFLQSHAIAAIVLENRMFKNLSISVPSLTGLAGTLTTSSTDTQTDN